MSDPDARWPALPLADWAETYATLHMYAQIVGKIRLALTPRMNQWWNVPFYLTPRGLTTGLLPCAEPPCALDFDFFAHALVVRTIEGGERHVTLGGPVQAFYREVMEALAACGSPVRIRTHPVEVEGGIPFERDARHATYDPEAARRVFGVLARVQTVFERYRAGFDGKQSPVHFYWGSFDLAVSRHSGRPAAPRPEMDAIMRHAYDAEQINVGFWPGGDWPGAGRIESPLFYAYAYPAPEGVEALALRPDAARWDPKLGEHTLPYDAVRRAPDPEAAILAFAESAFEQLSRAARWPGPASAPCVTFLPGEPEPEPRH